MSRSLILIGFIAYAPLTAQEPAKEPTEKQFRRMFVALLEDPTHAEAQNLSRAIVIYTIQTDKAAVVIGKDEMAWCKDDKRGLQLMAAYVGGNTLSQLHSGVMQNDRYSGIVMLFRVYRHFREKDKDFKIDAVEDLLKLHKDGKLLAHVVELEKKKPTKLSAEDEAALQKLLKDKK
jgi:hypothetical protein